MIEAELKAQVKDVEAVRTWLRAQAEEEAATYYDTYYDWPDRRLDREGREIRLRSIQRKGRPHVHILTYKQPPLSSDGESKPEYESEIGDASTLDLMFRELGLKEDISLTKHCWNFRFSQEGYSILATLASVPELEGFFLEVETLVSPEQLAEALGVVKGVAEELGLSDDVVSSKYTDAVRCLRKSSSA